MLKASILDGQTFRELRDDPSATVQAIFLVGIVGLCYGGGLGLFSFFVAGISTMDALAIVLTYLLGSFVVAIAWSAVTFLIVTKLFRVKIGYSNMTRPFFFSWAPGLLFILMSTPVPTIADIFRVVTAAWIGIASVFAVKYTAEINAQKSMLTFIMSILVLVFLVSILPAI